jgi:hypothetical protein
MLALEKFPLQQAVDQKEQVHAKPFVNLQETRRKFAPMSLWWFVYFNVKHNSEHHLWMWCTSTV